MAVVLELEGVAGRYAVCRLDPDAPVPAWAAGRFVSVTRTADELSVVCPEDSVPQGVPTQPGWRLLRVSGTVPFFKVGVLAAVAGPLARVGVSLLVVCTFDTDYLMVPGDDFDLAVEVLRNAGHVVRV